MVIAAAPEIASLIWDLFWNPLDEGYRATIRYSDLRKRNLSDRPISLTLTLRRALTLTLESPILAK